MTEVDALHLTGLQRAAIFMVSIGKDVSADVLKYLPEDEAQQLADAIPRLNRVDSETANVILEEFSRGLGMASTLPLTSGLDFVREMLPNAFDPETATRLLDRIVRTLEEDGSDFRGLSKVESGQLARLIQDEHPQTIAVIISSMESSQAAALLRSLPTEVRGNIVMRMAAIDQISPEVIRTISSVVKRKLEGLGEISRESCGGVRSTANMLNRLDATVCSQILDEMESSDPKLLDSIRRLMFVFNDLQHVDLADLKQLVAKANGKSLTTALKGADGKLLEKIMNCMSGRAAEMLREDIVAVGNVKPQDVDTAQQEIISVARQLEKEGIISLKKST